MSFRGEPLLRRSDALAQGPTDSDIERAIANGDVVVVRRDIRAPGHVAETLGADERHLLDIRATLMAGADGTFASHQSAAFVHRMSLWRTDSRIHIGTPRRSGGHVSAARHLHAEGVGPGDIDVLAGIPCTSAARTVADLARSLPFEDAVCVGDSAVQRRLTHVDAIRDALERTETDRRKPSAQLALDFLDGRSESVGESRSRVYLRHFDIPPPELQVTLTPDDVRTFFRPDPTSSGSGRGCWVSSTGSASTQRARVPENRWAMSSLARNGARTSSELTDGRSCGGRGQIWPLLA